MENRLKEALSRCKCPICEPPDEFYEMRYYCLNCGSWFNKLEKDKCPDCESKNVVENLEL